MYKVTIINQLSDKEPYVIQKETTQEISDHISYQMAKSKCPYGELERWVPTESLTQELENRILQTKVEQVEQEDEEGNVSNVNVEFSLVRQDFVISDAINLLEQNDYIIERRTREYKKIDGLLMEALVEKELGNSSKWDEYIILRNQIKLGLPKV